MKVSEFETCRAVLGLVFPFIVENIVLKTLMPIFYCLPLTRVCSRSSGRKPSKITLRGGIKNRPQEYFFKCRKNQILQIN